ncbi:Cutinase [Nocardia otitidiscaviarum]|uniref:Cutinase n=1 Tax=Nocardia otitidiscaviarum TaxID=1823 RepID=A0A379JM37_9NOCA|nr:cutinase family protein [Nocardia otitidiscaviarum]SUD49575.1 Cutinase [Nocardia otitidiscaviarum]
MRKWWKPLAAATAVAAIGVGAASTGAGEGVAVPTVYSPGQCTQYTAIMVPGTWETNAGADPYQAVGMLKPIGDGLKQRLGNNVTVMYAPYPASAFDQGLAYNQSKSAGVAKVNDMLTGLCAQTKVVLGGYSQGADVMGDVAAEIGNGTGPIPAAQVVAVGLLSDPRRDPRTAESLGPSQNGHGIAGVREKGFGALTPKVRSICGSGDLYCSVDESSPFVSAIGQILGGNADPTSAEGQLTSSLISDFSKADLAGLNSAVGTLADRAGSLPSETDLSSIQTTTGVAGVGAGANALVGTLEPLQDVVEFAQQNPYAVDQLKQAPTGSPEADAAKVLDTASQVDLVGAITQAVSLANTASQILSGAGAGQPGTATVNPSDALTPRVEQLANTTNALQSLDTSTLTSGLGILKLLKPNTIIKQITNAGTGVAATAANMPRILDTFVKLPGAIATGNIQEAHRLAGDINNLFSPIIKMAAGVDLGFIASIISAASMFDPSGWTAIAGLIVGVLANLDIVRIANDIGQAQEVLWRAVEKLARGDLLGAGAEMTGLAPVGIDLAAAVAGMFTGAPKQDVERLGGQTAVGAQSVAFSKAVSAGDLGGMASALFETAGDKGISDLVDVAAQGIEVATFYASGAHVNYGDGVQQLLQFILRQIGS